jgi:hypothetical protein
MTPVCSGWLMVGVERAGRVEKCCARPSTRQGRVGVYLTPCTRPPVRRRILPSDREGRTRPIPVREVSDTRPLDQGGKGQAKVRASFVVNSSKGPNCPAHATILRLSQTFDRRVVMRQPKVFQRLAHIGEDFCARRLDQKRIHPQVISPAHIPLVNRRAQDNDDKRPQFRLLSNPFQHFQAHLVRKL